MSAVPASTLNAALIQARASVQARVFKAQYNKHQKYSYVSHEAVLLHARDALLSHGLLLEQRSVTYDGEIVMQTREGPRMIMRWSGVFALVHERGDERLYTFCATTQPNDKASYVASTSLDKVALMRVMQIAGTDDENAEANWHDDAPGGVAHGASQPARQPAPQPAQRGNVVNLRPERPQGLSQQLEWSVGLKTFALELARVRDPHALVQWWVKFKVETAAKLEPGLVSECWQMFSAHVRKLDLDLRAIAAECDNQVKAMRATKGGV